MTNVWNERFSRQEYIYGKEPNAFIAKIAKRIPKGKILCIAEGEGRNAVYLAKLGFDVTAWDYAQAGLDKTTQLAAENGVTVKTELRDLAEVVWQEEQWDAIIHVFGHLAKSVMDRTLKGVQRALKYGGSYVSELYSKEQLRYKTGGPANKEMLIDPKEMLTQFKDFHIQHFYVGEALREEGILHTGTAHIVQSMFQKEKRDE